VYITCSITQEFFLGLTSEAKKTTERLRQTTLATDRQRRLPRATTQWPQHQLSHCHLATQLQLRPAVTWMAVQCRHMRPSTSILKITGILIWKPAHRLSYSCPAKNSHRFWIFLRFFVFALEVHTKQMNE